MSSCQQSTRFQRSFHCHILHKYNTDKSKRQSSTVVFSNKLITRLPSNLMLTTRDCVHLVTDGHFRSRDRDGGHTIRSDIAENSMPNANLVTLSFVEAALLPIIAGIGIFNFLLLWPSPWSHDLHIRTCPLLPGNVQISDINFVCQGFQKLSYDRQTDRHDQNYIPRRFAGGQLANCLINSSALPANP